HRLPVPLAGLPDCGDPGRLGCLTAPFFSARRSNFLGLMLDTLVHQTPPDGKSMSTTLILVPLVMIAAVVVVVLLLLMYGVSIYNRLVTLRNRVDNAFSQIEVQLKRRHDLIPNLVETAKGYMAH